MKTDSSASASGPQSHQPYVPADRIMPELTLPALIAGVVLGILFGASSLYLSLKVGLTVSASIPIAVISITLFRICKPIFGRNATILENNIVQTTGSAGESIAFGVGVTMPAIMILGYNLELARVMVVAVLGGLLGILMMIPLRRAFIVKQHGRLPYPEGTACAEVLIAGEKGGATAATVFAGFGFAFVYQVCMQGMHLWKEVAEIPGRIMLRIFPGAAVNGEVAPALLGVGYIIGTKISCVMVAGGVLAAWIMTPAIRMFGAASDKPIFPGVKPISEMNLAEIRDKYVLYIGAGAVATGGIISMIQAMPTIVGSIRAGMRDLTSQRGGAADLIHKGMRTDRDLSMKFVLLGVLGLILAIWAAPMLHMNILGASLIVLFGFLFVTVSSRLVGEIGSSSNPISGMTVATLLMTCLIFLYMGWTSGDHRLTALSIAGIVCVAASNGGNTSQDLKTGFLIGATPRAQQIGILVGALTSALVIGCTLILLNDSGTVYSQKDLPTAVVDVSKLSAEKERAETGSARFLSKIPWLGASASLTTDPVEYFVLHANGKHSEGVPDGKYLVNSLGQIKYFVDPAINGVLTSRDDGTAVANRYNAPKARLMSLVIDGILKQDLPWSLVLLGVAIALVMELCRVPSLPFAVGVYLPLSSSTPIFLGGMLRWLADKWARRSEAEADMSPGVLLSAGYIAGGAMAGVLIAFISFSDSAAEYLQVGKSWLPHWHKNDAWTMVPFCLLAVVLLLVASKKSKPA